MTRYAVKIVYPPYKGSTFDHLDIYLVRNGSSLDESCSIRCVLPGEELTLTLFATRDEAVHAAREYAINHVIDNGLYGWEFKEVELTGL